MDKVIEERKKMNFVPAALDETEEIYINKKKYKNVKECRREEETR